MRVDADDFNETAGISKAAARRVTKQQAALQKAAAASLSFEEQFAAHVSAMEQSVEGNYKWRVVNLLNGLVQLYEFVHAKRWLSDALAADHSSVGAVGLGKGVHVAAAVKLRQQQCMARSREVAIDIVSTIGEARQQTYLHDLVYGVHRIFDVALHILHAGMQGVEHVNKQMKLVMVSQCTAANNNRRDNEGRRMIGDVAQTATAIVARSHIINGPQSASLPSNQYSLQLQGEMGWGSQAYVERTERKAHKMFAAASVSRLSALEAGLYSPQSPARAASPEPMAVLLSQPGRKRRFDIKPSPLGSSSSSCEHTDNSKRK